MKKAIIIQARMTSTRLPGKVMREVLGKPLLQIQLERLVHAGNVDEIIVATTTNDTDRPIVELCNSLSIPIFRGSEEDVLERYYQAATEYNVDIVIRITSDCPVIDPRVVEQVIDYYLANQDSVDYVSNTGVRTYPRGMDTEVFSRQVLEQAYRYATKAPEREHVTLYIYRHPELFKLGNYPYWRDVSHHRWTVDTLEDFELIKRIIDHLYPKDPLFSLEDTLELLDRYPEWVLINQHVKQKSP